MKTLLNAFIVCVFVFSCDDASYALTRFRNPAAPPGFAVAPNNLNFGSVNTGANKMDSVVVTNTGTTGMFITNTTSDNTEFTITPRTANIGAGNSRTFYITFAPLTPGSKTGNIVFSHTATGSPDTVTVQGSGVGAPVFPVFSVTPGSIAFGDVQNGTTKRDSVTVSNTGTSTLSITSVTSSSPRFTISPNTATIGVGASRTFVITFAPLVDGAINAYVRFNHNAVGGRDSIAVSGTGTGGAIEPKFSVNPVSLNFGSVQNGTTKQDSVFVTNTGTANLNVSGVTSSSNRFTITPTNANIAAGSSRKFTITFAPLADGQIDAFIRFNHNATGSPDTVVVTGIGTGGDVEPVFSIAPTALAFGDVNTGSNKQDSVFVTNSGTATMTITSVTRSNQRFSVTPGNASIAPGASRKFTITFTPTVAGLQEGFIRFNHNAKNAVDSIPVSGNGVGDPVAPKFSASTSDIDFGTVTNGTTKIDSVIITNAGTANLTISSVTSTDPQYTISPGLATIAPSATRKFTITFNPLTDGDHPAIIEFVNNTAKGRDTVRARGQGTGGNVEPVFSVTPLTLDFDTVSTGMTRTDSVLVKNVGTANLVMSNITSTNARFTISQPRAFTLAPQASRYVRINFSPQTPGVTTAYLHFDHNAATQDSMLVRGEGIGAAIEPRFTAQPRSLDFGTIQAGTTIVDSVTVSNTGNSTLTITQVTSTSTNFTVSPNNATIPAGTSRVFRITFAPMTEGVKTANVLFVHSGISIRDTIPVTGTADSGLDEPVFRATPASLNLRGVVKQTFKLDSVAIRNAGRRDLFVYSVTSSHSSFTVFPSTINIPPSESATFFITFSPPDTGTFNAVLVFNNNAASRNDTVMVTGRGLRVLPISNARAATNGTDVAFEGIVTRSMGTLIRIQDQSGAITVRQTSGILFNDVASGEVRMGDRVRLQGRVSELNALKLINTTDYNGHERLSRDNPLPTAVKLTLKEIAQNGEQYESSLITVIDLTIANGGDTTFRAARTYQITDPSDQTNAVSLRITNAGDTDVDGRPMLSSGVTFTGVLSQSSTATPTTGYQLMPILTGDLQSSSTSVTSLSSIEFFLSPNYPNPFNPSTTIEYRIPTRSRLVLKIYNILGIHVTTLVDEVKDAGEYRTIWNATNSRGERMSAGVYQYELRIEASGNEIRETRKMILLP